MSGRASPRLVQLGDLVQIRGTESVLTDVVDVYRRSRMKQDDEILFVLTPQGPGRIIEDAAVGPFVFDEKRARRAKLVVCAQTLERPGEEPRAPHLSAFLLGKIRDIVPALEQEANKPTRWLIRLSATAEINLPNAWTGSWNPIRYTTLSALGIDQGGLDFTETRGNIAAASSETVGALTLEQARAGLAAALGVSPTRIRLTITEV